MTLVEHMSFGHDVSVYTPFSKTYALFCMKFMLLLLADLDIQAIGFVKWFEGLLKLIPFILRSCSENEVLSFSRLVKEMKSSLEKWRSNKQLFESEVMASSTKGQRR